MRDGTTWRQQAYLKASNAENGDGFGVSVAVSGNTIVVGAPLEDSSSTEVDDAGSDPSNYFNSGAAYVFVRNGGHWTQQAYLKPSNTGSGDEFGRSVSVSADTIVVGAISEDSNATGVNGNQGDDSLRSSGAAYVFVRSGTTWSQQAYLKASNSGEIDRFGHCVSVSGDTVVVGAIEEDSATTGVNGDGMNDGAYNSGAAYVFVRSGTNWSQQAYLKASNTGGGQRGRINGIPEIAGDEFGDSLAVSGDTIVVGAPHEDSNATGVDGTGSDPSRNFNSGAAYVFVRNGSNWTQQAYLKASNTGSGDFFGESVSMSGDTIVVGANLEDSGATGVNGDQSNNDIFASGAAYAFVRQRTTWSQQAYLKASNPDLGDRFGSSVAMSGDTIVIGVSGEESGATGVHGNQCNDFAPYAGAAYVFTGLGPPPSILTQPDNLHVNVGSTAEFTVLAEGSAPLHYQWVFNDTPVAAATNATLTLSNVHPAQAGVYAVWVSNRVGSVTSSNAVLHVNLFPIADASATPTLVISPNGTNANGVLDGSRSSDPDSDPLTYLWRSSISNLPSSTIATGMIAVVSLPVGTNFIELVVDDGMAQDTNTVTIRVLTTAEAVERVIELVNASGLQHQQPLLATLNAALASIERGNCHSALGQLGAFQNKVQAQVTDTVLANELIEGAAQLIAALDCGGTPRVAAKIRSLKRQPNGKMEMKIKGEAGKSYILEASTNLVEWKAITVLNPNAVGECEFEDRDATELPCRFYRVRTP